MTQAAKAADKAPEKAPDKPAPDIAGESSDVQAAAKAGLTESDIHALRDDAGLNGLAGHQANVKAWEQSQQGKDFIKAEKDRNKEAEAAAKSAHEGLDKDDKSEADKSYEEAVSG